LISGEELRLFCQRFACHLSWHVHCANLGILGPSTEVDNPPYLPTFVVVQAAKVSCARGCRSSGVDEHGSSTNLEISVSFSSSISRLIPASTILLLSPFFSVQEGLFAEPREIKLEHYSTREGMIPAIVRSMMQDRFGYLWFATYNGLDRYDGNTFVSYKHDPADRYSISNARTLSLCEDHRGDLWVGTWHGLEKFDRKTEKFYHYLPHPSADSTGWENVVFAVHEDREGILWIGTGAGLYVCDRPGDTTLTLRRFQGQSETSIQKVVRAIVEDRSGRLWVATGSDLLQYDRSARRFVIRWCVPDRPNGEIEPRKISEHWIFVVYEDHDGMLWLATNGGLVKFDPNSRTSTVYRHNPNQQWSLNDNVVLTVGEDAARAIWAGTDYGLVRFDRGSGRFTKFVHDDRDPKSLKANRIYAILSERSGTLWISTLGGGVHKLNRPTPLFTTYRPEAGGSDPTATSFTGGLAEVDSGVIWANTYFNGIEEFSRRTETFEHLGPRAPFHILMKGPRRSVWIAPSNGELGMSLLDRHGRLTPFEDPQGRTIRHPVGSMCQSREGFIWVATAFDLWTMAPATHSFTHVKNLKAVGLSQVLEDRVGIVWVGTAGSGLFRYDRTNDSLTLFPHDPENPLSISGNMINAIMDDTAEGPWFGTDAGLDRFNRQTRTFTHFSSKYGLPNDGVFAILRDDHGILWLSTLVGLVRFVPATKMVKTFEWSHVMPNTRINVRNAFRAGNGEMYFGSEDGLIRFHPDSIKDNLFVPPIVITEFKTFDKPVRLDTAISEKTTIALSYKDNVISFEFAALNYLSPERNLYAYQMEGFDTGWVYCGSRRYATYTNLDGGEYVFRVKGSNNDGVWNEEGTSIALVITPPFWATWWFRGFAFIAILVSVGGSIRFFEMRKLKGQIARLEQERALEDERIRISQDLHDEVGASLSKIAIISEVAIRNSGGATGVTPQLQNISQLAGEIVDSVSAIVWAINPHNDKLDNLVGYMREYASDFFENTLIECRFEFPDEIPGSHLSAEIRRTFFLVMKEALNNVVKHSCATMVQIGLTFTKSHIELRIEDNGKGFVREHKLSHGNGLCNMRTRIEDIHGTFEIQSQAGNGTRIRLVVPTTQVMPL